MRLHHLEITAFGPFGGTVEVDFDTLGADGLFLLHGQTGAGKTTVLDAVAFALYGRVPGARNDGKRLLSDHAANGAKPKVVLEATVGGRRMRITRSPEYQRPKMRGTGTTKENAKASLEWLDGHGENLTRLDEIGETVGRLLGMSADQFFQVVLLPQGDFARFLRADSDDRGVLLERLFDTGRFADVEDWFALRRRDSESRVAGKKSEVERLAAQVCGAAGIEAGADGDPIAWAQRLVGETRSAAEAADLVLTAARDRARQSEAELRRRREVLRNQERAAVAGRQLADHATDDAARAELAVELDRAVRAVPVSAARHLADRAVLAAERELAGLRERTRPVAAEPEGRVLVDRMRWPAEPEDADALAAAVREWGNEVARLSDLIERDGRRRDAHTEMEATRRRRDDLAAAAERVAVRRVALPAELDRAESALAEVRAVAATLPTVTGRRDIARERLSAAIELESVGVERVAAADRHRSARDAHLDARDGLTAVREQRIAGMAAELAADLAVGESCPVCGSAAHPDPAQPAPDAVSRTDEDAARAVEQRRGRELEAAAATLAELDRKVGVLADRVGDADTDTLTADLAAAESAVSEAESAVAAETPAAATVSILRVEADDLTRRSTELSSELAALDQRIADDGDRLAELDRTIAEAIGHETNLQSRRDRLAALAESVIALRDQRVTATIAATAATDATTELARTVAEAGFASPADVTGAVRPQQRIDEIGATLTQAREDRVRAEAVLTDPAVVAALTLDPADVPAAEAAHADAARAMEDALQAAGEADNKAEKVAHYARALTDTFESMGPVLRRHEELAALADVVAGRGQNSRKMSLRSYVLAARLEEVALSASARLSRMSGGRYEFVHEDGAGPRGKRGGLGLDIRDDYTGVVRSAKTLSGGESFLASLALALGLADVVAAESGGVVLDTMFIDEGFGTLDAETLESVMGVLDELRAGGRVVGIVSHVDEMRQRIPSRLHVLRGRTGSTLAVAAG